MSVRIRWQKYDRKTKKLTRICDLSDHCIKGETDKAANGDPMSSSFGIKYLRGNDPGERATAHGEGELKYPSEDEERPEQTYLRRGADIVEPGNNSTRDDETDRAGKIPNNQGPASSNAVDKEDGAQLTGNTPDV